MKRWHEETALMLRRWREEIAKHRHRSLGYIEGDCHCLRGKGTMRKRTPWGHRRRCYLCKGAKYNHVGRPWRGDGTQRRGRSNWDCATMRLEEEADMDAAEDAFHQGRSVGAITHHGRSCVAADLIM